MSDRGIFLAFEGIDGSGKSTQARRVASERDALFTFEPGDTALGAQLRQWLLNAHTPMSPTTEALLMLADRSHHVREVLEPALSAGRHVVSDRYVASTLAYQGYGRGVDLDVLSRANDLAVGQCRPTLTILLDLSVELARERRGSNATDRFESSGIDFDEAVRHGYLALARAGGASWCVIDASATEIEVAAAIDERVNELEWSARD